MIDKQIKSSGHTWKSYSQSIEENPKNFKRKLVQNIEKINRWIGPLGMKVVIVENNTKINK